MEISERVVVIWRRGETVLFVGPSTEKGWRMFVPGDEVQLEELGSIEEVAAMVADLRPPREDVQCLKCGNIWTPRDGRPKYCPMCKSPKWAEEAVGGFQWGCARCGHTWHARRPGEPVSCPKCRSTSWQTGAGARRSRHQDKGFTTFTEVFKEDGTVVTTKPEGVKWTEKPVEDYKAVFNTQDAQWNEEDV